MTIPSVNGRWRRSPRVAFVDDGQRVVALSLRDLRASRPLLLAGPGAVIWRALADRPCASDLARLTAPSHLSEDDGVDEMVRFLEELEKAGLAERDF